MKQGNYTTAAPLYQRALSIREQALGPLHLDTAETLHGFAMFLEVQGNLQEAASLYLRALTIREPVFGSQHPKTVEIHTAYAALLQRIAKHQQSDERSSLTDNSQQE